MNPSDHDLLGEYVRNGSQAAFAELVRRHLNLVYSAAQRQVRSAALAEEIAQSVFVDLARNTGRIKAGTPLVAWLHLVTRRTAIDTIRRESRRQAREQIALEISTMKPSPSPSVWTELEPLLDEALEKLPEADRSAVLLRFFENKSLREVGEFLGASEEAAQKRVTRAVERLRVIFARRGIVIGAGGLASELSAHGILAAPVTLSAAIATGAASTGTVAASALCATQTLAMTTLQKTALLAVFALAAGGGLYETMLFARQNSDTALLRQRVANLDTQLRSTRDQRVASSARLNSVERQIDARMARLNARVSSGDAALEAQMKTWLANLDRLKEILEQRPNLRTPELQLLTEEQWFEVAAAARFESEEGIRRASAHLRRIAANKLSNRISNVLGAYLAANHQTLPADIMELIPYFDPPIDAAMLDGYEMLRSGKMSDVPPRSKSELVGSKAPVDIEYDQAWKIGANMISTSSALSMNIADAQRAFSAANNGRRATTAAQLLPYLKWPVEPGVLEKHLFSASAILPKPN